MKNTSPKGLSPLESAARKSPFVWDALVEIMNKYGLISSDDLNEEQREELSDLVVKKVCSIFKAG